MSKFFKRIGTSKYRYQFDIYLQDANLNIPCVVNPLSIVLKRGSKKIETKGKLTLSDGVLSINQRMSMLATMYRDKKGKFQEKTATIQVITQVEGKTGANKLIAATKIDLSRYAIPPKPEARTRGGVNLHTPRDRSVSSTRSGAGPNDASSQTAPTQSSSTQCVHQICLKLLKSSDPDARLSLQVRSLYVEEAATMSEISSIGSDYTSMGELSCDSDCSQDRSGLRMSNLALKKKAKKLSLQNQKELEIMSREQTPQVQVKRVELHKKNIRSQDVSSIMSKKESKDGNTPRPFQDFSTEINIHQLKTGIYKTEIKDRPKSPLMPASDTDENEKPRVEMTQAPRVAEYSVGRDSSRSNHSCASYLTQEVKAKEERVNSRQKVDAVSYGSLTSRGKREGGSYQQSFQMKLRREEEFRNVINKLKDKKPAFNLAKEAFLASSKKILAANIVPNKRFKNYSFSGASISTHSETVSGSSLEGRIETPPDLAEEPRLVKGAVCLTESTPTEERRGEKGCFIEKLEQSQRENDSLRMKLSKIQKENSKLKMEKEKQSQQLKGKETNEKEVRELMEEIERENKEKNIEIKKLKEKLEIQNNVVRDLREKLEVMVQRATNQEDQSQGWSRQGVMREMDALKKELRQRVEEKKKEIEKNKILYIRLDQSQNKNLLLEKETIEYRAKLDELLFSYQSIEEELAEERALHRETKMLKQDKNTKRVRFQEMQVKQKVYEIQNLKSTISDDMSLMRGEIHEYSKEIQKQLTQIRIEHQLQKEKQREIERYSQSFENDLMEAKIALGRYKDDNVRFQKHIDKLGGELESSKEYARSLEIDVFRSRQELAESVNVIGEYEKENLDLQNRLNCCYEKLKR